MYLFNFLITNSKKLIISFCLLGSLQSEIVAKGLPSEYYEIEDINEAKAYFVEYLYHMILKENNSINEERKFVESYLSSNILNINFDSKSFYKLLQIKQKYKIKNKQLSLLWFEIFCWDFETFFLNNIYTTL